MVIRAGAILLTAFACFRCEASIADGLAAYWQMEGDAQDSSGNFRNLALYDSPGISSFAPGRFGQAFSSAYLEYMTVDPTWWYASAFNFLGNDFTIQAWVRPLTLGGDTRTIVEFGGSATGWRLSFNDNVTLFRYTEDPYFSLIGGPPSYGAWQHTVVRRSGSVLEIFRNGSRQNSNSIGFAISPNYTTPFTIGASYYEVSGRPYYVNSAHALVDDVAIWNRAITDDELSALASYSVADMLAGEGNGGGGEDITGPGVPEPATWWLSGAALLAVVTRARRRRSPKRPLRAP